MARHRVMQPNRFRNVSRAQAARGRVTAWSRATSCSRSASLARPAITWPAAMPSIRPQASAMSFCFDQGRSRSGLVSRAHLRQHGAWCRTHRSSDREPGLQVAELGRPLQIMAGGVTGWLKDSTSWLKPSQPAPGGRVTPQVSGYDTQPAIPGMPAICAVKKSMSNLTRAMPARSGTINRFNGTEAGA